MAQVSRSVALAASPDAVWAAIGGFHALAEWHPAVESATREEADGAELRCLALVGGGEIVEKLLGAGPRSYGYAILSGPLPVADYAATLTVAPSGSGSVVVWASTFAPTADDAEAVIGGVYDAGLEALKARFG